MPIETLDLQLPRFILHTAIHSKPSLGIQPVGHWWHERGSCDPDGWGLVEIDQTGRSCGHLVAVFVAVLKTFERDGVP